MCIWADTYTLVLKLHESRVGIYLTYLIQSLAQSTGPRTTGWRHEGWKTEPHPGSQCTNMPAVMGLQRTLLVIFKLPLIFNTTIIFRQLF